MIITPADIFDHASSELVFKRGQKYYENGHVGKIKITNSKDELEISAKVEGQYDDYQVNLVFEKDKHMFFDCECPAYYEYTGACKHVVALMLKYYHEIQKVEGNKIRVNEIP